ncbi:uncharacterized protein LOC106462037 [Limulus polyphemus]|uniref:Uncharacterized protein LOC106462037 n=1 Tax=Limulus polyphemus TaxID=6850 RepID=A0ABM1B967_LIMPO|nr:uncharacterized protein LOC106462037 [Limulus polyphemus]
MVSSEAYTYLSSVKWGSEGYYLKEFTQKFTLPQVAKIIKGQYLNLGVPTLPSPSPNNVVFLASGGKRIKMAAQCVKFKENRRVILVGPKLAIPDNYDGWFEILSEDGRPMRCIESVAEMSKRFPSSCLVRENIKVFVSKIDDPENVSDKTRSLQAGETIHLVDEILAAPVRGKAPGRFLRCLTDRNDTVYLSHEQRGKFSPMAGEDNISGVHTIKTILSKRLPLMVRLVHGKPPTGLKSSFTFLPEMRLYSLFEEECIMALPLLKDSAIVPLPLTAPLKLQSPRNVETLVNLREYTILNEKCNKIIQEVSDKIQVFDISMSKELRSKTKTSYHYPNRIQNHFHLKQGRQASLVRRSLSDPQGQGKGKTIVTLERGLSAPGASTDLRIAEGESKEELVIDDYDEIDQIYDYVRGLIPLPEKIKRDFSANDKSSSPENSAASRFPTSPVSPVPTSPLVSTTNETSTTEGDKVKPEPPPVETIPARKMSTSTEPCYSSGQKITVSIVQKPSFRPKGGSLKDNDGADVHFTTDHTYEKLDKRKEDPKCTYTKSNHNIKASSDRTFYIPSGHHPCQNNKFFIKNAPQQRQAHSTRIFKNFKSSQTHSTRIFKHSKSSPVKVSVPFQRTSRAKTCRSNKSITTSPLFNIRYKSLTNLAPKFNNTLESSNSVDQTSSGSGLKELAKDTKGQNKKLPRPKSLTNLFWESSRVDNYNNYNLVQNEINRKADNTKYLFSHELSSSKLINGGPNKRIGTLYL